jgi:hypothetical protein
MSILKTRYELLGNGRSEEKISSYMERWKLVTLTTVTVSKEREGGFNQVNFFFDIAYA